MSALAGSPWWRRGRLARLVPDAPAAAFVDLALFGVGFPQGRDALSAWLFAALRENASSLGGRLGRVFYDLHGLGRADGAGVHPLEKRLDDMLVEAPDEPRNSPPWPRLRFRSGPRASRPASP